MRKQKESTSDQCSRCLPAACCMYYAFEIDRPETRKDYESLLWKLAHKLTSIYIYRKKWYLMIHTRCNFLNQQNKCDIYEQRPYLCREHSTANCEFSDSDYGFSEHFRSYDELLVYIRKNTGFRFKNKLTGVAPNCV